MRKVTAADLMTLKDYDKTHDAIRRQIVELKSRRRVTVGRYAMFVFENFETVRFQIHEMLRVERLTDPEKVQFEIDTYNELLPLPGELSATLFLEIDSAAQRKILLPELAGIEKTITLEVGEPHISPTFALPGAQTPGDKILSRAERIQSFVPEEVERPDYASSVYFLHFPFLPTTRAKFMTTTEPISLVVDHRGYRASHLLPEVVLAELRQDLETSLLPAG